MNNTCKGCEFWFPQTDEDERRADAIRGECRKRSPFGATGVLGSAVWPSTDCDDWCGDWKKSAPIRNDNEDGMADA